MLYVPHDIFVSTNLCNSLKNDWLVCHHGCDVDMASSLDQSGLRDVGLMIPTIVVVSIVVTSVIITSIVSI